MEKDCMTVGELAKRMGTTVRTLQYYDREGLLSPSARSEGGRRLYTSRDMVRLHQIQAMKYLGFSLDDIKNRLVLLEEPAEVAALLKSQEQQLGLKIEELSQARAALAALREEVVQMKRVDFKKYADIVALIRMKNDNYWVVKYFDDHTMEQIRTGFDEESARAFSEKWQEICERTAELARRGAAPDGEEGQKIAGEWWDMVLLFSRGDPTIIQNLMRFNEQKESWKSQDKRDMHTSIDDFIGKALEAYFIKNQIPIPEMGGAE